MPQITAIKPQKNKKRVNVYLDGKFGFGLDYENFSEMGLKVEQHLDEEEIKKIIEKAEFKKTSDKLIRFATIRPRSKKEIKDWLRRKKVHASLHDKLFNKLKRLELLDDLSFAKWWVEQRIEFKPRGVKALYSELMKKGVDKRDIEDALSEVDIDEEEMAKELFEKNSYKWGKYKGIKKKKKASDFLARRGFRWGVIKKVINSS